MAGFVSRISFVSTSSLVVILTFFWYLRKKKSSSVQKSIENIDNLQSNIPENLHSIDRDLISMNLKEGTDESKALPQQNLNFEEIIAEKMHLKGETNSPDSSNESEINTSQVQINGATLSNVQNGNHIYENGTTCETTTQAVTNGTSHLKRDNTVDKKNQVVSEVKNENNLNSHKANGYGDVSKLTNGVKSLNLDKDIVEQEMFNGKELTFQTQKENSITEPSNKNTCNGDSSQESFHSETEEKVNIVTDANDVQTNNSECSDIVLESELSIKKLSLDESANFSVDDTSSISTFSSSDKLLSRSSDEASINANDVDSHELSCDTNFERKTLTPDSGVPGELQECDSASSTISDHLSDCHMNGIHSDVLKSPSVSESSNDSGKDCSENHFEDQGVVHGENALYAYQPLEEDLIHYDFAIPQKLCGYLIGKNGRHVRYLIEESNTNINIGLHPFVKDYKICTVSGTEDEIKHALSLIREKFPIEKYPELSLESLNPIQAECTLPVTIKLTLPEGVNFDAILSSTVTPGHFFLQQPTHPTYHTLSWLSQAMSTWYNSCETPRLFKISVGNVVAAPMCGGWYRAEVTDLCPETDECTVKFLDFGGYCTLSSNDLRQMKVEYAYIPFQAVECFLGNVTFPDGHDEWSEDAKRAFEDMAQGQILQGYIVGYEDGIPYVHLYKVQGASTIFINRELVNRQLGQWRNHLQPDA